MFGTYVASRSVMFERSSLLPNIEALYINSLVYISFYKNIATQEETWCDCRRKCTKTKPIFVYVLFTKIYSRRGVFNAYLQILLLDFSP